MPVWKSRSVDWRASPQAFYLRGNRRVAVSQVLGSEHSLQLDVILAKPSIASSPLSQFLDFMHLGPRRL